MTEEAKRVLAIIKEHGPCFFDKIMEVSGYTDRSEMSKITRELIDNGRIHLCFLGWTAC